MAYLAIARKFRPLRFEDIVGQGHVTRTLQNAIGLNRTHHAFLFTGARGVGKTTAARVLARCLNCEKGPTPTPCNECTSCREVIAGIASDVVEIDAASNNGVDNIRDLRDNIRYLPASGRRKIYIIDEVHMLSTAAFNALLKTLEEPPAHVTFIMATTDPQKVPETILSRCQRFDFKRIPLKQIAETLGAIASKEGVSLSENSLLMLAREADGSMRDAQSLLDQVISAAGTSLSDQEVVEVLGIIDRRQLFECLLGVLEQQPERALAVVDQVYSFGFDMKIFARELLEVVRNLNVVRAAKEAERFVDVSSEELQLLRDMARQTPPDVLSRLFSLMVEGFDALARSESPRMVLELTLLRMVQVRPVQPLDELLTRLTHMESLLRGGAGSGSGGSSGGGGAGSGGGGAFGGAGPGRGPGSPSSGFRPPGGARTSAGESGEGMGSVRAAESTSASSGALEARGGPPVPLSGADSVQGSASRIGAAGAGQASGGQASGGQASSGQTSGGQANTVPSGASQDRARDAGPIGPGASSSGSVGSGGAQGGGIAALGAGGGARVPSMSPPAMGAPTSPGRTVGGTASSRPTAVPSAPTPVPSSSSRAGFAERIQGIAKAVSDGKPALVGSAPAGGGLEGGGARPAFSPSLPPRPMPSGFGLPGGSAVGSGPAGSAGAGQSASEALRAKGLAPPPSSPDGEDAEMPVAAQPLARARTPVRPGIVATMTLAEVAGPEVAQRVSREGPWIGFVQVWQSRPGIRLKPNYLKHGEPLQEEGERMVLGFRNQLTLSKADQEASEPEVLALLREHFGRPLRIECRLLNEGEQAGPGFVEWEQSRERLRRSALVQKLVEDARLSLACSLFGASKQELRFEFERARH